MKRKDFFKVLGASVASISVSKNALTEKLLTKAVLNDCFCFSTLTEDERMEVYRKMCKRSIEQVLTTGEEKILSKLQSLSNTSLNNEDEISILYTQKFKICELLQFAEEYRISQKGE